MPENGTSRLRVRGNRPDNPVSALTEFFCHSITLIDDEVLAEDLKDLATLNFTHGRLERVTRGDMFTEGEARLAGD